MKIAQIATLVSPDGAYGGPLRVAVNQIAGLIAQGHDARIFASYRGFDIAPSEVMGVPLASKRCHSLAPGLGFAGLYSPSLMRLLGSELKRCDIVHVHLARDLITLPAAHLALRMGKPVVVQTHGMIDPSSRLFAKPLDVLLTKPVLRNCDRVLYLTSTEKSGIEAVEPNAAIRVELRNGVPTMEKSARSDVRVPVEVLYLARLQERKRPREFVLAAREICSRIPNVKFTLVGPDEGEGPSVERAIRESGTDRISWEGPIAPEETLARMSQAHIYVLPSVNEPFPMSVLEAASCGLPCIVTEKCGLAAPVRKWGAGLVVGESGSQLTAGIERLLNDSQLRRECGVNARAMVESEFDISVVVDRLVGIYDEVLHTHQQRVGHAR